MKFLPVVLLGLFAGRLIGSEVFLPIGDSITAGAQGGVWSSSYGRGGCQSHGAPVHTFITFPRASCWRGLSPRQ